MPDVRALALRTLAHATRTFNQGTASAGELLDRVRANKPLAFATHFLPTGWLAQAVNGVDTRKSQKLVDRLQRWYPTATPRELAGRMMQQKAVQMGSLGFVTGLVPGFLAPLLLVDVATSAVLMAELVFQIAAAYRLDLNDPKRKGEVLAIFGIAFGGQAAVRAGLTALRAVPIAGAMVGAGTNAALIHALGHAACNFYESGGHQLDSEEAVAAAIVAQEPVLAFALRQEILLDQLQVCLHYALGESRPLAEFLTALEGQPGIAPAAIAAMRQWPEGACPAPEPLIAELEPAWAMALLSAIEPLLADQERVSPPAARLVNGLIVQSGLSRAEFAALQAEALAELAEAE